MSATISDLRAKVAATRIGVTVEEYLRRRTNGEKWCPKCRAWRPDDVNHSYCRDCKRTYEREAYGGPGIRHIKGVR